MRAGSTLSYLHSDQLGSVSASTSSTGTLLSQQSFSPWGSIRGGAVAQTGHNYTGQVRDGSGLLYYNARYYDPVLARFLSADTDVPDATNPQDFNRYSYVANNPLRFTDPTGHSQYDGDGDGEEPDYGGGNYGDVTGAASYADPQTYSYNRTNSTNVETSNDGGGVTAGGVVAMVAAGAAGGYELAQTSNRAASNTDSDDAGATQKPAVVNVPDLTGKSLDDATKDIEAEGFEPKPDTAGGNKRWYHPDGSRIWIDTDGNVERLGPKNNLKYPNTKNNETYRGRYKPNGEPLPRSEAHHTGEIVKYPTPTEPTMKPSGPQ